MTSAITIGVSACLLGQPVRYDGGHQLDRYITDVLGRYFTFLPVCPEAECGLGVPREAMRLEGDPTAPRLVTRVSRRDLTEQMTTWCDRMVDELEQADLCGFIFKSRSPSSGLFRVKVYQAGGTAARPGRGLFAAAVASRFPLLPMEEEGRLNDPHLRENFIERVFCYRRWKDFLASAPDLGGLVAFHTAHKLLVMSHSVSHYREMGALVATGRDLPLRELTGKYEQLLMTSLALQATPSKQTNVLMHIMGYFKRLLDPSEKQELLDLIDRYRRQTLPLAVPLTMLNHYVRKYDQPYLKQQVYLSPHPAELMLRNHV